MTPPCNCVHLRYERSANPTRRVGKIVYLLYTFKLKIMTDQLDIQKLAYALIIVVLLTYISIVASSIILPFLFGLLFMLLLHPICNRVEKIISNRVIAIFITFCVVLFPLVGIFVFFSSQFVDIFENTTSLSEKMNSGIQTLFQWINEKLGLTNANSEKWLQENASKFLETPAVFIGKSISSSSAFLGNFALCLLYCFFLLLYRQSFKTFFLYQVSKSERKATEELIYRIQKIVQEYLSGLAIVMILLGIINSIGLYFIGISYSFFWGFLAAFLAIIPYIGTFIGGFLTFIFTLATTSGFIQPLLVVALFVTVQALEGNIITPKIVGSSVKINPLAAIFSIVIGGTIWGVSGLILSIPLIAILRILMKQFDYFKPLSLLLGDDIYDREDIFERKYDQEKFRLINFFTKQNTPND